MKNILFLKLGPYFPASDISVKEKYNLLSKNYEGEIIAVVNRKYFRHYSIGNFLVRGLYLSQKIRYINLLRNFLFLIFTITIATYSHYFKRNYDVIIAYDPLGTGIIGLIISKLIGAKFIVEVNGNFKAAFISTQKTSTFFEQLKKKLSEFIIPLVLKHADGIKLLYQNQMEAFNKLKLFCLIECFHDFVPVSHFKQNSNESKYILFMGHPWHLKGVDILIRAFNQVSPEFPEYILKIVGYCDDKTYFTNLCENNDKIHLCHPVQYNDAIKLMEGCALFILPSRTEAMGRVLLEAMASKKPIIASDVDGIPTYIKHSFNGLLFQSENVQDLAEKMRILLKDKKYAEQLAENGYRFVVEKLSEKCYLKNYSDFIERILNG
jgi:glycosyltransferase involved in cell wall biosynthesis